MLPRSLIHSGDLETPSVNHEWNAAWLENHSYLSKGSCPGLGV